MSSVTVKIPFVGRTVVLLLSPEDEDLASKKIYIQRCGRTPSAFYYEDHNSHTVSTVVADRLFGPFERNRFVTKMMNGNRLDCRRENISLVPRGMRTVRELEQGIYRTQRKSGETYCVTYRERDSKKRHSKHFKTLEEARAFRREHYIADNPLQLVLETREPVEESQPEFLDEE